MGEVLAKAFAAHGEAEPTTPLRFAKRVEMYGPAGGLDTAYAQDVVLAGDESTVRDLPHGKRRALRGEAYDAAHFTATLPWRLRDAAAALRRLGDTSWPALAAASGRAPATTLHRIQARYPGEADGETFVHFFDAADGRHVGYWIAHAGQPVVVVNEASTAWEGFVLPTRRATYRLDSAGRFALRRAAFAYEFGESPE